MKFLIFFNRLINTNNVIIIIFTFYIFSANAQVAINTTGNLPDSSAALDIQFNNKGVLFPRITTAERDAIVNPANSLIIFNTSVNCYQGYNALAGVWENIYCFHCTSIQQTPVALTESNVSITSFTANWNTVPNTYAYYLDVASDPGFTNILPLYNNLNVGSTNSYSINNLTCGTTYYYRVRSLGACGISQNSNSVGVNISCSSPSCFAIGGINDDRSSSMVTTSVGGLYISGWTSSFGAGSSEIYITKIDTSSNVQWLKTIGGSNYDYAYASCSTTDDGITIAGTTGSFGAGNADIYLVKLDTSGNILWTKTIGGSNSDYARAVTSTTDGGCVVAGYTNSFGIGAYDMFIIKLNATGSIQWSKTVGGNRDDIAYSVIQTYDGGYITAGKTNSYGAGLNDVYITRLDANGNLLWTKTIGGSVNELAYSITKASDSGYLIAGWTTSYSAGGSDVYIIKIDDIGNILWTKTIGGSNDEGASFIIQTSDGGYAVTGGTKSYGAGNNDIYFIKLDINGNVQWLRAMGGNGAEGSTAIVQISNGSYFVAGMTTSIGMGSYDIYVVKAAADGTSCCSNIAGGNIGSGGSANSGGIAGNPAFVENTSNPEIKSGGTKKTQCP